MAWGSCVDVLGHGNSAPLLTMYSVQCVATRIGKME